MSKHFIKIGYLLLLLIFAVLPSQQVFAQEAGTIEGYITDAQTGKPVVGAGVVVLPGRQGSSTNEQGHYRISNIPAGQYTLATSHLNFEKKEVRFSIALGETRRIDLQLINRNSHQMEPVTVIARRQSSQPDQRIDVRSTVNPSRDAGDFLRNVPNVGGIRKGGGNGVDPVIRGFKKQQLNVQFDGAVSVQGACPNRMDPPTSHVQIEDVERVEVLKGPYALRYGPSFGGVVNFISRKPQLGPDFSIDGHLSSSYESNVEGKRVTGGLSGGDDTIFFSASGSYSDFGDYKDGSGATIPAGVRSSDYAVRLGGNPFAGHHLEVGLRQSFMRDADYPALMMDMREDNTTIFNLDYSISRPAKILNSLDFKAYHSYVDHLMDNRDKDMFSMVSAVTDARTRVYGMRAETHLNTAPGMWYIGSDMKFSHIEGIRTRDFKMGAMAGNTLTDNVWQNGETNNIGFYTEYRTSVKAFELVGATRIDFNWANAEKPDPAFAASTNGLRSDFTNYSISAGVKRSLGEHWMAGLWLGRGVRSPGLQERYINYLPVGMDPYEYIGNPGLKPEINNQADLMLQWDGTVGLLKTSVFYSRVDDFISAAVRPDLSPKQMGVPGVKQFTNVDHARLYGFEATWQNPARQRLNLQLSAAYTIGDNLDTGDDLPQIPPFEVDARLSYRFLQGRLIPRVSWRGVTAQNRVAESYGETRTPGFSVTDATVSAMPYRDVTFSIGVKNIFDKNYYEHLNRSVTGTTTPIYDPGRSLFFELKIESFSFLR